MSVYELVGFNTDSRYREDVRYRTYTTSERRAKEFDQIDRIQFSDSGHGIVFSARPHRGRRLPECRTVSDHVQRELARIAAESKPPPRRASLRQRVAGAVVAAEKRLNEVDTDEANYNATSELSTAAYDGLKLIEAAL